MGPTLPYPVYGAPLNKGVGPILPYPVHGVPLKKGVGSVNQPVTTRRPRRGSRVPSTMRTPCGSRGSNSVSRLNAGSTAVTCSPADIVFRLTMRSMKYASNIQMKHSSSSLAVRVSLALKNVIYLQLCSPSSAHPTVLINMPMKHRSHSLAMRVWLALRHGHISAARKLVVCTCTEVLQQHAGAAWLGQQHIDTARGRAAPGCPAPGPLPGQSRASS